ncbi:UNVERIFIED_CONTAM: hypothetical protein Cloal_1020 [Acetivibrio alkalicellulosi]
MSNTDLEKIALFRFSLIAPLVNDTYHTFSKEEYYRKMASKDHRLPDGTLLRPASTTLKKWYLKYMKMGIDGLMPKVRKDVGRSRVINHQAVKNRRNKRKISLYNRYHTLSKIN